MPPWLVMGQNLHLSIFIYPKACNSNQSTASKGMCSGSRLHDLTPICAKYHSNSTQVFNITHKMSVYFTSPLTPLNLLCTSLHITTILLQVACKSISTTRNFSFSISKARLNSSTHCEWGVSAAVSCSWYSI